MKDITQNDVFKYELGLMTDLNERRAVEHAREYDPLVRYWFSLLADEERQTLPDACRRAGEKVAERAVLADPSEVYGRVWRTKVGYEYRLRIEYKGLLDRRTPAEMANQLRKGESYEIDTHARVVRFTYPAVEVPYGVARVFRKEGEVEKESLLVAFREWGVEPNVTRQTVVRFAELGISLKDDTEPSLYVVFATDENLAEFAADDVQQLRDRCNGDRELRGAVELLLQKLPSGAD